MPTPRDKSIEAHATFIEHDAHCRTCSQASRYGPAWKRYMCPEGLRLYEIADRAHFRELLWMTGQD